MVICQGLSNYFSHGGEWETGYFAVLEPHSLMVNAGVRAEKDLTEKRGRNFGRRLGIFPDFSCKLIMHKLHNFLWPKVILGQNGKSHSIVMKERKPVFGMAPCLCPIF